MGWLARVIVTSATLMVGCATLAGIGDSNPVEDNADGSSGTNGTSGTSGKTDGNTLGDGASTDGAKPDGAPACGANESKCASSPACCGKCNEQTLCKDSCSPLANGCSLFSNDECCLGAYCTDKLVSFAAHCVACIKPGFPAEKGAVSGQALDRSCCSRSIGQNDNCN